MSLIGLSKRQPDLLSNTASNKVADLVPGGEVLTKDLEAPRNTAKCVPHELLSEGSRMNTTVGQIINAKRLMSGGGQAEQMILELNSAAQINRGPGGVFESSRLHFDMLLGRDSEIHPSDYLNYDAKMKM